MTVDVDFGRGIATQRIDEQDPDAEFWAQNDQVNDFMAQHVSVLGKGENGKFKPFEDAQKPVNAQDAL